MKRAVILHGTMGSPEGNWFRWLEQDLKTRSYEVWLPALPHADHPSLREWADFVQHNTPFKLDGQTLLIGHSSGAILSLILTQESPEALKGVAAVSVFHDNSLDWRANDSLFDVSFDFAKIRKNTGKLLFIHSDDDPYVPIEQAQYVADNCQAELVIMSKQGHFNLEKSETYKQFPALIPLLYTRQML